MNQNLVPFNTIPSDRHRELSRKGGIASGKARRAKRQRIEEKKQEDIANAELLRAANDVLRAAVREVQRLPNRPAAKRAKHKYIYRI